MVQRALCGLICRKERWGLSFRGWLMLLVILVAFVIGFLCQIHPFLAVTRRLDTDILVVEGWIDNNAIAAAAAEFTNGPYRWVFTTGGPGRGSGPYSNDSNTSASVGAGRLKRAGVPEGVVQMAPSRVRDRDRTYSAALALRNWFREHHLLIKKINVMTEGVHARRTWFLFQKAMGNEVSVGVIAIPDSEYSPDRWWRYSEGIKSVISEGAAYFYVRLFFSPGPE